MTICGLVAGHQSKLMTYLLSPRCLTFIVLKDAMQGSTVGLHHILEACILHYGPAGHDVPTIAMVQ